MAMLAEPRQRKRYNLVPRGKALFEDDDRFGTKMLEKMGWSKGKGLGANEDGSKDFVRVRYKNDANGFGYEDRDDQWTQHEESFNGLLKSLHGDEECKNGANDVENDVENTSTTAGFGFQSEPKKFKLKEKFSGESLEEKSKKSKVRVHYKKFTRGKDLSRYSEKDLANIFGKKGVEEQAINAAYDQFTELKMDNEKVKVVDEEKELGSNFGGVPTINTGMSVSDYFKQKMEAMKNKMKSSSENKSQKLIDAIEDGNTECGQEYETKQKKQKRVNNEEIDETTAVENVTHRKRKRKQNDREEFSLLNSEQHIKKEDIKNETLSGKKKRKEEKGKGKELKQHPPLEDMVLKEGGGYPNEITEEALQNNKDCDIFVAEKPTVKVEKKKYKKTATENIALDEIVQNETAKKISKKSKKKCKESKESSTSESLNTIETTQHKQENMKDCETDKEDTLDVDINGHEASKSFPSKNNTDVSVASNSDCPEELTLEALKAELNSYNIYSISTFCAEKFRNTDITCFFGSSLSQIVGYSLSEQIQLDIKAIKGDQERIMKLWNGRNNKYENLKYQSKYKNYMTQAYTMKKTNKKVPRISIKSYKRKDAFTGI